MGSKKNYSQMKYHFLFLNVFAGPVFYPKKDFVELKDEKSFIPGKLTQQIFFEPGLLALNDQLEASGHFALDEFFEKIPNLGRNQDTEAVFFNQMENDAMNLDVQPFTDSTTTELTSTTDELYSPPIETTTTEIITTTGGLYTTPTTTKVELEATTTTSLTSTK